MRFVKPETAESVETAEPEVPADELQKRLKEEEKHNFSGSLQDHRRCTSFKSSLEITEITPHLLLCGAVALRGNILQDLGVTCVINATTELPDTPLVSDDVVYLRVTVDDTSDSDILSWLDIVTELIYQVKMAGGRTLIHCVAGISRSASLCLAYLIKYEHYTLYDSYVKLKAMRHIIRPNSGFFGQLVEFEKRLTGKQTVRMVDSAFTKSAIPHMYQKDYETLSRCRQYSRV